MLSFCQLSKGIFTDTIFQASKSDKSDSDKEIEKSVVLSEKSSENTFSNSLSG